MYPLFDLSGRVAIANAGVNGIRRPLIDTTAQDFAEIFDGGYDIF